MKSIYKYPIEIKGVNTVVMPGGAKVLSIQMQGEIPTIWAMVDPDSRPFIERKFQIIGTGNSIPDDFKGEYITTFQERIFVWHIFEVTE